jgi:N-acetylneuraminic acid mutarotase
MIAMMGTTLERQGLPAGSTFRIVEAVKRIKINPMPRMAGLPWGLSATVGVIITVLGLNPHISIPSYMTRPTVSSLPAEMKVLKTREIPADILRTSGMFVISSKQEDGGGELLSQMPQSEFMLAPHAGGDIWTQKADMPTARGSVSASVVNGKIYAIGGNRGAVELMTVEEYDPATNTWAKKDDMSVPRENYSTSALNGKIYTIGGWNDADKTLALVEEYDPVTDTWAKKADMPIPTWGHSTCVVDGKIYVIGGGFGRSTVYEYDPIKDKWTKKTNMPTGRHQFAISVVDGRIYAIGGHTDEGWRHIISTVEEYDPATDTWTKKADMLTARGSLSASAVNGKIYAIGGLSAEMVLLSTVEEYYPKTDIWKERVSMPTPRGVFSTSVVNDKIYAIGGKGPGPLSCVEEYTPEGRQPEAISSQDKLSAKWSELKSD